MIEAKAKRAIEDERRKLNLETTRKLREAEESSKTRFNLNEAKMHQIRVTALKCIQKECLFVFRTFSRKTRHENLQLCRERPILLSNTPHLKL